jgi:predicted Zn-dependent peptidase
MVAVNVLYNVGARDESPDKTGLAHLFEHLMFGGSENIEDFDDPIQRAGGENNAFTNNDITNFYDIIPAQNLEVALWLESDRMLSLNFDEEVLEVQRKVVIEEFKESCLNQPYGDVWHHIADMAYKVHPYQWPTIGKVPQHVEDATLEDVKDFYQKFYNPNNAILTLSGNVSVEKGRQLVEKWFGDIPAGITPQRRLPQEPPQNKLQQRINQAKVPVDALYLAFHSPGRSDPDFYISDILSDVLGNGSSARLYRKLLKEKQVVNQIDCYVTGSMDPGLFIIEARPAEGVSLEEVERHIWAELEVIRNELVPERELQKLKNKIESTLLFSEMSVLNKAMNLAFFELLGDAGIINEEADMYHRITREDVRNMARKIFTPENCNELYYKVQ